MILWLLRPLWSEASKSSVVRRYGGIVDPNELRVKCDATGEAHFS